MGQSLRVAKWTFSFQTSQFSPISVFLSLCDLERKRNHHPCGPMTPLLLFSPLCPKSSWVLLRWGLGRSARSPSWADIPAEHLPAVSAHTWLALRVARGLCRCKQYSLSILLLLPAPPPSASLISLSYSPCPLYVLPRLFLSWPLLLSSWYRLLGWSQVTWHLQLPTPKQQWPHTVPRPCAHTYPPTHWWMPPDCQPSSTQHTVEQHPTTCPLCCPAQGHSHGLFPGHGSPFTYPCALAFPLVRP